MSTHGVDRSGAAGGTGSAPAQVLQDFFAADDADEAIEILADAATAETAPAEGDLVLVSDVSANDGRKFTLANLWKVIAGFTAKTVPLIADSISVYSAADTAVRTVTFENLLKIINGLTEDTAPHGTDDYLVTYDASASAVKKIKLATNIRVPSGSGRNIAARTHAATPNSQLTITADELTIRDTAGASIVLSTVSVNPAITAAGADGLDTGAEANSTWYYGWVIYNPTTGTVSGLISASATAPTMPSGYTFKALVTVVRNDGSGNFIPFRQYGNEVFFNTAQNVVSAGTATSETAITTSAAVPSIAQAIRLNVKNMSSTADGSGNSDGTLTLRHVTAVNFIQQNVRLILGDAGLSGSTYTWTGGQHVVPNTGALYYLLTNSIGTFATTIDVAGFTLPLGA